MDLVRKYASGVVAAGSALGERQIRAIASDATPDRAGDIMVPSGCQIEFYKKNNIVLADHDPTKPIGNAAVTVKADKVEALITFAPAGISAKADEYCGLVKAGVISAVSVGFDPIKSEPRSGARGWLYVEWELLELSVVAVPANPAATVIERRAPAGAWWQRQLAQPQPVAERAEIRKIQKSGLISLTGPALDAWLAKEYGHVKPDDRNNARLQRRYFAPKCIDRWRERERESDFAKEYRAQRSLSQLDAPDVIADPTFRWDPYKSAAHNIHAKRLFEMRGGRVA